MRHRIVVLLFALISICSSGNAQIAPATGGTLAGIMYVPYTPPSGPPTTGLWAYLNASTGITQSSNRISVWADGSGNAHDFSQASTSLQPLWNGVDSITFSGSRGDLMKCTATLAPPYAIYVIGATTIPTSGDGAPFAFDDVSATNLYFYAYNNAGTINTWAYGNGFANSITNTTSASGLSMYKVKVNGASSVVTYNTSVQTGNLGSATTVSPLNLGYVGTNTSSWGVKCILIYQGTFNETDIETYLHNTYGKP